MRFKNPSAAGKRSQQVQAEKRMSQPAPDYPPLPDYNRLSKRITIESFWSEAETKTVWELFPSKRRRDRFRVVLSGEEISKAMGWSAILAMIRKGR